MRACCSWVGLLALLIGCHTSGAEAPQASAPPDEGAALSAHHESAPGHPPPAPAPTPSVTAPSEPTQPEQQPEKSSQQSGWAHCNELTALPDSAEPRLAWGLTAHPAVRFPDGTARTAGYVPSALAMIEPSGEVRWCRDLGDPWDVLFFNQAKVLAHRQQQTPLLAPEPLTQQLVLYSPRLLAVLSPNDGELLLLHEFKDALAPGLFADGSKVTLAVGKARCEHEQAGVRFLRVCGDKLIAFTGRSLSVYSVTDFRLLKQLTYEPEQHVVRSKPGFIHVRLHGAGVQVDIEGSIYLQ